MKPQSQNNKFTPHAGCRECSSFDGPRDVNIYVRRCCKSECVGTLLLFWLYLMVNGRVPTQCIMDIPRITSIQVSKLPIVFSGGQFVYPVQFSSQLLLIKNITLEWFTEKGERKGLV